MLSEALLELSTHVSTHVGSEIASTVLMPYVSQSVVFQRSIMHRDSLVNLFGMKVGTSFTPPLMTFFRLKLVSAFRCCTLAYPSNESRISRCIAADWTSTAC
jgi:hypothetical protein